MIDVGDKVLVFISQDPMFGVVKEIYDIDNRKIFIVNLENGETVKVNEVFIERVPNEREPELISKENFENAVMKTLDMNNYISKFKNQTSALMVCMVGTLICDSLRKELFGKREND